MGGEKIHLVRVTRSQHEESFYDFFHLTWVSWSLNLRKEPNNAFTSLEALFINDKAALETVKN